MSTIIFGRKIGNSKRGGKREIKREIVERPGKYESKKITLHLNDVPKEARRIKFVGIEGRKINLTPQNLSKHVFRIPKIEVLDQLIL